MLFFFATSASCCSKDNSFYSEFSFLTKDLFSWNLMLSGPSLAMAREALAVESSCSCSWSQTKDSWWWGVDLLLRVLALFQLIFGPSSLWWWLCSMLLAEVYNLSFLLPQKFPCDIENSHKKSRTFFLFPELLYAILFRKAKIY